MQMSFFVDWFRFNSFANQIMGRLFLLNESMYGPLARFLFQPQELLRKRISSFKEQHMSKFDYIMGLDIWTKGLKTGTKFSDVDKLIYDCIGIRKKQIEWSHDKTNVGIFISSDSYDVKLRAAKYLGNSAIFISNTSTTGDEVKDKLINMWLLGDCNEVITTPKISNFTRAAVGRTGIPVYEGLQCRQHNTSTFWVKSPESCIIPSKCGKSIKNPWRADPPFWFFLRLFMFLLIPLGLVVFAYKWFKERRRPGIR